MCVRVRGPGARAPGTASAPQVRAHSARDQSDAKGDSVAGRRSHLAAARRTGARAGHREIFLHCRNNLTHPISCCAIVDWPLGGPSGGARNSGASEMVPGAAGTAPAARRPAPLFNIRARRAGNG